MKKIMFNEDSNHFVISRWSENIEITEQLLYDFIYQYKDTQVTDFAMCVNCQISSYPSKSKENYIDRYNCTEDIGIPVNYKNTFAKSYYDMYQKNIDMYRIWIDALREIGIRPYISFRMNDVHNLLDKTHLLKTKEIYERNDLWRAAHREANGYFDRALDFSHEEVRNKMLDYIEETLKRYRPDGIELDFTREMFLFSPGRENCEVINDMMKKIRLLTEKYPDKDNKALPINVLLCGSVCTNLNMGLDIFEWVKESLVDSMVCISRWDTTNTDCEIELWKKIAGNKILLGGGHQLLVKPFRNSEFENIILSDTDMAFGQAYANLSGGCDFVYLYNHMDLVENGLDKYVTDTSVRNSKNLTHILKNAGCLETIKKQKRRHVLTFDDSNPYWEETYMRLPISLSETAFKALRIRTGKISSEEKAYVILAFNKDLKTAEKAEIYVNSQKAKYIQRGGLDRNIINRNGYMFEIPENAVTGTHAVIEIRAENDSVLEYAEVMVLPCGME